METLRKSCSSLNRVTMPEVGDENAGCQSCNTLRKQTQHSTHSTSHSHCWGLFHICDWAHRGSACDRPANTRRKEKKHQSNVYAPYVCVFNVPKAGDIYSAIVRWPFILKTTTNDGETLAVQGGRMNGWGDDKKTRGRWEESEKEEEEEEEERGRETSRRKQWTEERGACERVDR